MKGQWKPITWTYAGAFSIGPLGVIWWSFNQNKNIRCHKNVLKMLSVKSGSFWLGSSALNSVDMEQDALEAMNALLNSDGIYQLILMFWW